MKKLLSMFILATFLMTPVALAGGYGGECSACGGHYSKYKKSGMEDKFYMKAHFIMKHADEIGLSDEAKQDIKDLKMNLKKNLIRKEAEIDVLKIDIKAAMKDYPIDGAELQSLIDQKYTIKKEKASDIANAYTSLKNGLSQAQYNKLKEIWYKDKD